MNLSELILTAKADKSYEQLARQCGGAPTAARLQQLATKRLKNFPDPDSIRGMANGFGVDPAVVINASAESLGFEPQRRSFLEDILPRDTAELDIDSSTLIARLVAHMRELERKAWPSATRDKALDALKNLAPLMLVIYDEIDPDDPNSGYEVVNHAFESLLNPSYEDPWPTELGSYLLGFDDGQERVRAATHLRQEMERWWATKKVNRAALEVQRHRWRKGESWGDEEYEQLLGEPSTLPRSVPTNVHQFPQQPQETTDDESTEAGVPEGPRVDEKNVSPFDRAPQPNDFHPDDDLPFNPEHPDQSQISARHSKHKKQADVEQDGD